MLGAVTKADPDAAAPPLDPEVLDRLRRALELRIHRDGAISMNGEAVTHPNVARVVRAGLDVGDDGSLRMVLGPQWCYVQVDDTPLRVRAVLREGERLLLRLDDGRTVPLDPATLEEDDVGLRARVPARRSGRPLAARFENRALSDLAPDLREEGPAVALDLGGRVWPIRRSET